MGVRARIALRLAPTSPCPHCGRNTKTVQGVCADCWASKDGRVRMGFKRTQGSPSWLEDVWWFVPWNFAPLVGVMLLVGVAIYLLIR